MKRADWVAFGVTALGLVGNVLIARHLNEQAWTRHQREFDLLLWIQETLGGQPVEKGPLLELYGAVESLEAFLRREGRGARLAAVYDPDTDRFAASLEDGEEGPNVQPLDAVALTLPALLHILAHMNDNDPGGNR